MTKFNWGHGIVTGIILFITFIMIMVYMASQHKVNLVSKDYYPKELEHQNQMDRINNAQEFINKITIDQNNERLKVVFPEFFENKNTTGNLHFFRPSDYELDQIYDLELNKKGEQTIDVSTFNKGKYILKINWSFEGKEYYFEQELKF